MAVGQVFTYLCTAVFNIENSNNRKKKKKRLDKNYRKKLYEKGNWNSLKQIKKQKRRKLKKDRKRKKV